MAACTAVDHPSRLAEEGSRLRMTFSYSTRFTNVSLCARSQRHKFVLPYQPKNVGLDTVARVFKTIADVGDGLPIDVILGVLDSQEYDPTRC